MAFAPQATANIQDAYPLAPGNYAPSAQQLYQTNPLLAALTAPYGSREEDGGFNALTRIPFPQLTPQATAADRTLYNALQQFYATGQDSNVDESGRGDFARLIERIAYGDLHPGQAAYADPAIKAFAQDMVHNATLTDKFSYLGDNLFPAVTLFLIAAGGAALSNPEAVGLGGAGAGATAGGEAVVAPLPATAGEGTLLLAPETGALITPEAGALVAPELAGELAPIVVTAPSGAGGFLGPGLTLPEVLTITGGVGGAATGTASLLNSGTASQTPYTPENINSLETPGTGEPVGSKSPGFFDQFGTKDLIKLGTSALTTGVGLASGGREKTQTSTVNFPPETLRLINDVEFPILGNNINAQTNLIQPFLAGQPFAPQIAGQFGSRVPQAVQSATRRGAKDAGISNLGPLVEDINTLQPSLISSLQGLVKQNTAQRTSVVPAGYQPFLAPSTSTKTEGGGPSTFETGFQLASTLAGAYFNSSK